MEPPLGPSQRDLVLLLFIVGIIAIMSLVMLSGLIVLDRLLPLLTFGLGYAAPRPSRPNV